MRLVHIVCMESISDSQCLRILLTKIPIGGVHCNWFGNVWNTNSNVDKGKSLYQNVILKFTNSGGKNMHS